MASLRTLTGGIGLAGALLGLTATWSSAQDAVADSPHLTSVIRMVLDQSSTTDVPFRTLIEGVTGNEVIKVQPDQAVDRAILDVVSQAMDQCLAELNLPDSPVKAESRINEASRHFEESLERIINAHPDFECAPPLTAEGKSLSSGYPDRRLVHVPSGRVAYLDPKLVRDDSFDSSFRSFYYTPRTTTNKVLDDAHHLLVGIAHDGKVGDWTFVSWKLVDLHDFQVRLKAEYQASNRDLYLEQLLLRSGKIPAP